MTGRYVFRAGGRESHWDSLRRLATEVGWTIEAGWLSRWRLRRCHDRVTADRASVTRAQFVERLARGDRAVVRFYAPDLP